MPSAALRKRVRWPPPRHQRRTPMFRRSAALLLPLLGALSACGSREQQAITKGHPNEVRAPDDYLTMAWRKDPEGTKPEHGGTVVLTILQDIDSFNPYVSSAADA